MLFAVLLWVCLRPLIAGAILAGIVIGEKRPNRWTCCRKTEDDGDKKTKREFHHKKHNLYYCYVTSNRLSTSGTRFLEEL